MEEKQEINMDELLELINNMCSETHFRKYADGSGGIYGHDGHVRFTWENAEHMQEVLNEVYYDYLNEVRPKIDFKI